MSLKTKRQEVEDDEDWVGEAESIPFVEFPQGWKVKIMPPFGNTLIRFRVKLPSGLEKSVFLDSRCVHGKCIDENFESIPYWEVSPVGEKYGQCVLSDIKTLLEMIAYEEKG